MSDSDDEITTEPPDPLRGAENTVAKTGERLQEQAERVDGGDSGDGSGDEPAPKPDDD